MITPAQIKAARALAGMTQSELAKAAGISATALNNIETGRSDPRASTLAAIQAVLEAAGVTFIEQDNGGPGVRLVGGRPSQPPE